MKIALYDKVKHAVRFWLLRRLPACKETVEIVSQSFERQLSLRERITVKLHFWICVWCQWYMEHLRLLRQTLRAKSTETSDMDSSLSPGLSIDARERIKRRLRSGE
ncbi:MAG TPA: hypothetical protein VJ180_16045 [Pyrinomonadaceae bacterium]|nr:hypothetical protein [Pyrinomonadaceae bacterium]